MSGNATNRHLPLILVRGFGGLGVEDEKKIAYQGFNDGTVYPQKRGDNYIYEGLILRFMKSDWRYNDATNVVAYYATNPDERRLDPAATDPGDLMEMVPEPLRDLGPEFFFGRGVVIDPAMARHHLERKDDFDPEKKDGGLYRSLWVFRYYDLNDRRFRTYGEALVRLIRLIRKLIEVKYGEKDVPVNIVAHSMGGLIVREALQRTLPALRAQAEERAILREQEARRAAALGRPAPAATAADEPVGPATDYVNKVVTLGTPHRGITFQVLKEWINIDAADELEHFNPGVQADPNNPAAFVNLGKHFPPERLLCVVGTDYRSYAIRPSTWLNRLAAISGEFGLNYNRSDGLVKQTSAQIPGAPRAFVHKCHGGYDSLVTARESYEVVTRFLFGNVRARLSLHRAEVTRGFDFFGRSEFFFGVSVKPRGVDFELFHQSKQAENCYGPFHEAALDDPDPAFGWAGPNRLIWEGWLNRDLSIGRGKTDLVMRLEFYLGERDTFGIGFSDNLVFGKQYYVRAVLEPELRLYAYDSERFRDDAHDPEDPASGAKRMERDGAGWLFDVAGTGFKGTLRVELDALGADGVWLPF
jgi:hypothetical protein